MIAQWWALREPREKLLIMVASTLSVLMLAWFGIISPLYEANTNARRELDQTIADKSLIDQSLALLRSSGGVSIGPATDFDAFRSEVTSIAQRRGLAISRLQGSDDGALQLVFSDVAPSDIFLWLEDISTRPGGEPIRVNLSRRDDKIQAIIDLQGARP